MMNDVFLKISQIIKTEFICKQNAGRLILQDSSSRPVEVKKKGKLVCLELDKGNKNIFPFFDSSVLGLCKIADRIIFYSKDDCLFVFIIELKTNNPDGAIKQVNASFCLAKYIFHSVERLLGYKAIKVEYRGLIFSNRPIKGTSLPKNLVYSVHSGSSLKFRHLPSGMPIELDTLTF